MRLGNDSGAKLWYYGSGNSSQKLSPRAGKVAANVMSSRKGNIKKQQSCFTVPPSDNPPKLSPGWNKVALLTFVRNSPCSCPFSVSLHPPLAALNSEPRKRWRLIVRFTSLHIKPALKGEVANVVSRRGYKAAYSSCLSQPLSQTFGLPAPRKGEPYEERISLLAQAPFFDAEIHRRSCVGEKSQTFSLFRR